MSFEKMSQKEHLRNLGVTSDQVKECFNCHEADIADDGDVWIANPQSGHWLREHEWDTLAKFVEERI
jgi:hypothetical protein